MIVPMETEDAHTLRFCGRDFAAVPVDEVEHYDFYEYNGEVAGLELLTLEHSHELHQAATRLGLYDSNVSPFPRWPLRTMRGTQIGIVAFGVVCVFRHGEDYLISVPLDDWLSAEQIASITSAIDPI